jgi:hypothetical protein
MAAGVPSEVVTRFPGGIGQFTFIAKGLAAGDVGCTGILKARDTLVQVTALTLSGVLVKAFNDYTGEFTIKSNNFINNTGGTSTAGMIVFVTVARKSA